MRKMFNPRRLLLASLLVAAAAAAMVFAVVGQGSDGPFAHSFPASKISTLTKLKAQPSVPPQVAAFVNRAAAVAGEDPAKAQSDVRLLRSGLGVQQADVYAFSSTDHGIPCWIAVGIAAGCETASNTVTPGFYWSIGGGYPGQPGHLIGITTDDVQSIQLTVDGVDRSVSVANNVAFAEYPEHSSVAVIRVTYQDGSSKSATINL